MLEVEFIDYVNPGKHDYDDSCCDLFCDDCDTYFEICLQSTYTPVARLDRCMKFVRTKIREDDNFNIVDAFGSVFGLKGEKNPIVHRFDDSWKVIIVNFIHLSFIVVSYSSTSFVKSQCLTAVVTQWCFKRPILF